MRDQLLKVYNVLNELYKEGLVPSGRFEFVKPLTPGLIDLEVEIGDSSVTITTKKKVTLLNELTPTIAKTMGYTGNTCGKCGLSRMVRRGTCEYCEDCQESSGCS